MSDGNFKLRVSVNQDVCVGAGLCVLSTSDVFDQRDEDGVVKLLQTEPDDSLYEKVLGAARKCPSKAIKVEKLDEQGAPESGQ
ncbi:ferredoxin [Burkholderia multivorans]|uniref:Ferredoxin n=1 Tax=Burkholderia multivorans TaxID=87883 RepID=A0AB37AWM4_9BURK|nr:ferredoxin [Burkholderia multivorans]MBU9346569.1 ferredoxin [Burkholderia multivorans]MCO1383863.1 ferredoxin [Burkholderia multivorans]MCO1400540.1 ferredoxin [Burkholderia multivorans]MDN7969739.1 ferredoxin [Burkholderia multivorans]PRE50427.1 ferredoxin [Burkholderia multivorans]